MRRRPDTDEAELTILRRAYARHVSFAADDPRLEPAFFEVRREAFLGHGPWELGAGSTPRPTPDAEPHWLYQDVVVSILQRKMLNNGQPSFLAYMIGLCRIQPGERVVHIGAGVGYYTAIMAELAGRTGAVTAIEYEPELAARAANNLAHYPQVETVCADGATHPLAPADVILVNAGASRPLGLWLDALKDGGRLLLPLCAGFKMPNGTPMTRGNVFLIERQGATYAAAAKSQVFIYPCIGASDAESEANLNEAMRKGGADKVRRLARTSEVSDETCWVKGPGWALMFE